MTTPSESHNLPQDLAGAMAAGVANPEAEPALGRDPFEHLDAFDPFAEGLIALGHSPPATVPTPLADDSSDWLDRLVNPEDRRRLAALDALVEEGARYDRFGLAPDVLRRAFPILSLLYHHYFRVKSWGYEHLPESGAAILAANRGGILPFDTAMISVDTLLHTDPPRLLRSVSDHWTGTLPWLNVFSARVGQVMGTRTNIEDLLQAGQILLTFPEGYAGALKPVAQRYCLQRFGREFVEQALRARVPIVPVAVIGSDDQSPVLFDFKGLARRLGLPGLPITPTFPWLGPLGLVPYPVRYQIAYGEPFDFHHRFDPDAADDAKLVGELAARVRREVQRLVDGNR